MADKSKICLVIPSLQLGGMERVMSQLANYFVSKRNLEIHIILYGRDRRIFYSIKPEIILHKPDFSFNDKLRFWYTIKTIIYVRKEINKINPDSILSFGEYWNSLILLALLGGNYNIYISDRCQPDKKFNLFHTLLRKLLYPKAKGIIAQTNFAKELYARKFLNRNIEIIGNPVGKSVLKNNLIKENIILSVGRLIESKHFDRLIRIFSNLNAPGWQLIIVGGDALKQNTYEKLAHLVDILNLNGKVFLKGQVQNVDEYYSKAKIFAFTSSSEGFPNVIGEALASSLPVVAYNCIAGPSEMIKNGENGFLVPVFDDVHFCQKLQMLIDDEDLLNKMSKNACESIKDFEISIIGEKYLSFILHHSCPK